MSNPGIVKWGVLGCGGIADTVTSDFIHAGNAQMVAAASRNPEKARKFCNKHSIAKAYGSYEELLADPEIELVYIAVPHSGHLEWSQKALEAGKAVLCEKPMTLNLPQSKGLFYLAQRKGLFIAEAWWTYYFPLTCLLKNWIESGVLGKLMRSESNFCFTLPRDSNPRMVTPELGGGALLDIGMYPLAFSLWMHDQHPSDVKSHWLKGDTGVDMEETLLLQYPDNSSSSLHASLNYFGPHRSMLYFQQGQVEVGDFFHPRKMLLTFYGKDTRKNSLFDGGKPVSDPVHGDGLLFEDPFPGNGYQYQIEAISRAISVGAIQDKPQKAVFYPQARTLQVMGLMDTFRKEWGLVYPGE